LTITTVERFSANTYGMFSAPVGGLNTFTFGDVLSNAWGLWVVNAASVTVTGYCTGLATDSVPILVTTSSAFGPASVFDFTGSTTWHMNSAARLAGTLYIASVTEEEARLTIVMSSAAATAGALSTIAQIRMVNSGLIVNSPNSAPVSMTVTGRFDAWERTTLSGSVPSTLVPRSIATLFSSFFPSLHV
jgi:hypothetical protein